VSESDTGALGLGPAPAHADANGHPPAPAPLPPPGPQAAPKAPGADPGRGPRGASPGAKAKPCGPCEDGVTIGAGPLPRPAEIALGCLGVAVGLLLLGMGLDLIFGGQLASILGVGNGNPGA
jgi:hypothetical protein